MPTTTPASERFRPLEVVMKKLGFRQDALIEILHTGQKLFGHLAPELLLFVARRLKLPPSRVRGVATFYHSFTLEPTGAHTCTVCTGTACFVKGATKLLVAAEREAHVAAGGTTPDGRLTLTTTRCLGACGVAPVFVADGTVVSHATPEAVTARVKGWLADGSK